MISSFSSYIALLLLFLVVLLVNPNKNDDIRIRTTVVQGFQIIATELINTRRRRRISQNTITISSSSSSSLEMGIFDSFFKSREDDFVKLEYSSSSQQDIIGPGPLIILYNIPHGIDDEEIGGMIEDGAPIASASGSATGNGGMKKGGVSFIRMYPEDVRKGGDYEDKSVIDVLQTVLPLATTSTTTTTTTSNDALATINTTMKQLKVVDTSSCPILYFSGISNSEMMDTYKIIAQEIYQETDGRGNAACAKVVEPAFEKRFRQLVEEISGDHNDAINSAGDEATNEQ
jgi:hypothetical protein